MHCRAEIDDPVDECFGQLHVFEALAIKLERPAVLSDSADDILRSTGRHVSFNFKGDLHLRIEQAGKVLNHGSGYGINVSG